MIEVKDLVKQYGEKKALGGVTFSVNRGEILGFLGPNGAGKTTTMNILTGYLSSTSGTATVDGIDVLEDPIAAKKKIGYLPEQPPLYQDMTVKEYLRFIYDLKKLSGNREEQLEKVARQVKITEVYDRLIKNLSKGYKQRVGLAQALLGSPPVLILDEPTVGLDPKQIIEIRNLIRSLGERHTVILSSHILSEVQAVCDRVVVINEGRIVADDTPDRLSHTMSTDHRYLAKIEGPSDEVYKVIASIPRMKEAQLLAEREPGVYEYALETEPGEDIRRELFRRLALRNWPLLGLKSSEMTLEDVFLRLTTDQRKGGR